MEAPAENWALDNYKSELLRRNGGDIGAAALYLAQHPNDCEAHRAYLEAIKLTIERNER